MEPKKIQFFIVRRGSPAHEAVMRQIKQAPVESGQIFFVDDEEFESFQKDFIQIEITKSE